MRPWPRRQPVGGHAYGDLFVLRPGSKTIQTLIRRASRRAAMGRGCAGGHCGAGIGKQCRSGKLDGATVVAWPPRLLHIGAIHRRARYAGHGAGPIIVFAARRHRNVGNARRSLFLRSHRLIACRCRFPFRLAGALNVRHSGIPTHTYSRVLCEYAFGLRRGRDRPGPPG
jgi:hypothetical protein